MRWTPVVLLFIAIAVAVIVARGLPEDTANTRDPNAKPTPVDAAAEAAAPTTKSE
ncbi:MAG: hypothetical protein HQ495_14870 [Alphaproteobacteria bacterium]|nr:hypothetical protein [Alphaproteobacteria bacterium]